MLCTITRTPGVDDDKISFHSGDVITNPEFIDVDKDWWRGIRTCHGVRGLYPANFVAQ